MGLLQDIRTLINQGQFQKAIDLCKQVPDPDADMLEALAISHASLGQFAPAEAAQSQAVQASSNALKFYLNLGTIYALQNKHRQALEAWQPCFETNQKNLGFLKNYALCAIKCQEGATAKQALEIVLKAKPDDLHSLKLLAHAQTLAKDFEAALAIYLKADQLGGLSDQDYFQLALLSRDQNHLEITGSALKKAITLNPDFTDAHFEYAQFLLREENWAEGFHEFEWRLKRNTAPNWQLAPELEKGADLKGKRLVIYAEQGLGDSLHFSQYLPILKNLEVRFKLLCHASLVRYFSSLDFDCCSFEESHELTDTFDYQCPLLSLPYRLDITALPPRPTPCPFPTTITRVGFCSSGSQNFSNNHLRSPQPSHFQSLIDKTPVDWIDLQPRQENDCLFANVFNPIAPHHDFFDTAKVIKTLDCVVTVDTSLAHLCGVMNVPTYLVLHCPPDWRWHHDQSVAKLYPNMKIFRQPSPEDWQTPFKNLSQSLLQLTPKAT